MKILETISAKNQDQEFQTARCDKIQYCVAVKREARRVRITGTTPENQGRILDFNPQEWKNFVQSVKSGQFDVE